MATRHNRRRVRPHLLVLLWIWALCVFTIVDLFRNVREFDSVRPRHKLYRAMRYAAHRMVGEAYLDGDFEEAALPQLRRADFREQAFAELAKCAAAGQVEAMRPLVVLDAERARPALLTAVWASGNSFRARSEAACRLAETGAGAFEILDRLLASELEDKVKEGAAWGLAEINSPEAVARLLDVCAGPLSRVRVTADRALAQCACREDTRLLADAARDGSARPATRVAACRALGETRIAEATSPLGEIAADPTAPRPVRLAATRALESLTSIRTGPRQHRGDEGERHVR